MAERSEAHPDLQFGPIARQALAEVSVHSAPADAQPLEFVACPECDDGDIYYAVLSNGSVCCKAKGHRLGKLAHRAGTGSSELAAPPDGDGGSASSGRQVQPGSGVNTASHCSVKDRRSEDVHGKTARLERHGIGAGEVARWFHEIYEDLAPDYGWKTQLESRKTWDEVPERNRLLMVDVAWRVLCRLAERGFRMTSVDESSGAPFSGDTGGLARETASRVEGGSSPSVSGASERFNLLKGPVEFDYDPDDTPDGTLVDDATDDTLLAAVYRVIKAEVDDSKLMKHTRMGLAILITRAVEQHRPADGAAPGERISHERLEALYEVIRKAAALKHYFMTQFSHHTLAPNTMKAWHDYEAALTALDTLPPEDRLLASDDGTTTEAQS